MKKIFQKILLLTLVVFTFTTCDNYLEFKAEGSIPQDEFFTNKEQAFQAVTAMYGFLRDWEMAGFPYLLPTELTSDDATKGSSPGDGSWANAYHQFQFLNSDGVIKDHWTSKYKAINLSNQVIANVGVMPKQVIDEKLKNRYVAEAKFLRAWHHFNLVRGFGGVVIEDKPASVGVKLRVRSTVDQCYQFIEADLLAAIPYLPKVLPDNELGRTTQWAARSILAKVYLYQKKWAEAKNQSDTIISKGGFDLHADFYKLFRLEQEFCEESIFEVIATQLTGNGAISSCAYSSIQGVRGAPKPQGDGWGWIVPSDKLAKAFDDAGDVVRKKATIMYRGDVTQDNDTIKGITDMEDVTKPRYNCKAYVPYYHSTNQYGTDQNIRLIRFAEVLLINAEAAFHLGLDAATPLNRVRTRAKLPAKLAPTLADIYLERRLELACEQDRFYDLTRTGQAASFLKDQGFVTGKHELFPIPFDEIVKSQGSLTQNPGW